MSKVDTDEGLGPGSERQRQEVLKAQKELESRSKQKAAAPASASGPIVVDKNAVTEPGIGKVERKSDTVDDLLGGFGTDRPNLPRILPNADTTPPPEPLKKELTPTAPGKRQRTRNMLLATLVTFGVVAIFGVVLVKYGSSSSAAPTTTAKLPATTTTTATATAIATETMAPITTTAIEALPTVKTSAPPTTTTATTRTVHSATTATATATATQTAPRPTGSAPPGMNLLPDDPHR